MNKVLNPRRRTAPHLEWKLNLLNPTDVELNKVLNLRPQKVPRLYIKSRNVLNPFQTRQKFQRQNQAFRPRIRLWFQAWRSMPARPLKQWNLKWSDLCRHRACCSRQRAIWMQYTTNLEKKPLHRCCGWNPCFRIVQLTVGVRILHCLHSRARKTKGKLSVDIFKDWYPPAE